MRPFVEKNLIFMTIAGSHSYGTSTADSDIDKRGVCVPPKNVVIGFANRFEQQDYSGEDTIVYSLSRFMQLASECNPNIIELLFAPTDCVQTLKHPWDKLLERRREFLTAQAYPRFSGYATSQLKRIKTHRAWLLNPPSREPTREDFDLPKYGTGVAEIAKGVDIAEISPEVLSLISREKAYKSEHLKWEQYQNWKQTRNPARSTLEAQFGYDTKHASHLVRLLRMGKQILTEGDLEVRRHDAGELLAIRNGKWTYDELMAYVDPLCNELETIYQEKKYVVPDKVDVQALSDFCVELHEMFWRVNGVS